MSGASGPSSVRSREAVVQNDDGPIPGLAIVIMAAGLGLDAFLR